MAIEDNIYGDYTPPTGSGNFFSLEDGKTARIRIQSQPYVYRAGFTQPDGTTKYSTRYAWLIFNHEEGKGQVLKQSGTFFSSLAAIAKDADYGDPTGYDLKVTRSGTGTDTKYALVPSPKTIELDEKMLASVAALDVLKDSSEDQILPLTEFIKNGKEFTASNTSAGGDGIVADNPLAE